MVDDVAWVELCGLTFTGDGTPGEFTVASLSGWWDLPKRRGGGSPIPGGHGVFRSTSIYREALPVTMTGLIVKGTEAEYLDAKARLSAAFADGFGTLRVATASGIWERDVEIDFLETSGDAGLTVGPYTVDLVAPDPRKYGPTQSTSPVGLPVHLGGVRLPQRMPWNFGSTSGGSRMVIPNAGKIPVHPVVTVTGGGFSQLSVVDITAARQLILQLPAVTSADVVLDSATHRVYVGGQEVTRLLTSRQWFEIPAGETHKFRFEAPGAVGPMMTASFRIGAW